MRARGGKLAVVAIATLSVALSAVGPVASAKPSREFPFIGKFELRGSKGYRVEGFFFANLVGLEVRSGHVSASHYVVGKRRHGRFSARFGRLGRVALRFHPGSRAFLGDRCAPVRFGAYRGTIAFAGERHYTEVRAGSASGLGFVAPPKRCTAEASTVPFNGGGLRTHLFAIARSPRGTTELSIRRLPGEGRLSVKASLEERRGKMLIAREAFARVGGRRSFVASGPGKHPAFAFLQPPKPFAGSALFAETSASASSWSGDLSAWMPGVGRVALAGPAFASSYCRAIPGKAGCPYEPPVQRSLSALQGSGSQSHDFGEARLSWSRYLLNSASSAGSTP